MHQFGVYRIRNIVTGDAYIGSTARKGFHKRFIDHKSKLRRNKHTSPRLQNAVNKYGIDNFVFEIVLYCDPHNTLYYEQKLLDALKPKYNCAVIAGHPTMGRKHSEETKALIGSYHKNKVVDKATRRRLSISILALNRKGELASMSKLTTNQVVDIKTRLKNNERVCDLARLFNVDSCTITDIKMQRTWKHV
jgi:group I intron endonuclease